MNTLTFSRVFIVFTLTLTLSFLLLGSTVHAATNPFPDLTFPIASLGNCSSLQECKTYCDDSTHQDACVAFAKAHGLVKAEVKTDQSIQAALKNAKGPGGCTTKDSCKTYCDDVVHISECVQFGKAHGLISSGEAENATKISTAIQGGVSTPGGCTTREDCAKYCSDTTHRDECVAFAKALGLTPPPKQDDTNQNFTGPGGCNSKDACATFCNDPANQTACVDFAKAHGLIKEADVEKLKQGLTSIANGTKNLPPEVKDCMMLNTNGDRSVGDGPVGTTTLTPKLLGTPTLEQIAQLNNCIEKYKPKTQPPAQLEGKPAFKLSDDVKNCISLNAGSAIADKIAAGDTTSIDSASALKIRACLEKFAHASASAEASSTPSGDGTRQAPIPFPKPPIRTYINGSTTPEGRPYPPEYYKNDSTHGTTVIPPIIPFRPYPSTSSTTPERKMPFPYVPPPLHPGIPSTHTNDSGTPTPTTEGSPSSFLLNAVSNLPANAAGAFASFLHSFGL